MIGRGGIITGYGISVPDKVVTNEDLSVTLDTNDAWIRERTGIRERRIGGTTSGLAIEAGLAALENAGRRPDEIDAIILATTTPDQIVPGTSAAVQDGIGIVGGAFDVNAACSGFVYALTVAHGMLAIGAERLLVIGSETLSKITDVRIELSPLIEPPEDDLRRLSCFPGVLSCNVPHMPRPRHRQPSS